MAPSFGTVSGFWMVCTTVSCALASQLIMKPINRAAIAGEQVILHCKSRNGKDIHWSKCSPQGNCSQISRGNTIVINDPEGKYSIENPSSGEFNLVINPLREDDGLRYECKVWDIFSSDTSYGELIVLSDLLRCSLNDTLISPTEGNVLNISCRQAFRGRWAPSIGCHFRNRSFWISMADKSLPTTSVYDGIFSADLHLDGDHIVCEVHFLHPQPWEYLSAEQAMNRPQIENSWVSPQLDILHAPMSLSWIPDDSVFRVGQSLTCTSVAKPAASYLLLRDNGEVIGTGNVVTFDSSQVGAWRLRCKATNIVGMADIDRQVYVYENELCNAGDNDQSFLIIGITLGIALFLSLVVNVILILCVKRPEILKRLGYDPDKTKTYRSKNLQFGDFSTGSSVTDNIGFGNPSAYQDILDSSTLGSVSTLPDQQFANYEPISFGDCPRNDRACLPSVPSRTLAGSKATLQRFSSEQGVNDIGRSDDVKPKPAISLNGLNMLQMKASNKERTNRLC